MDCTNATNAKQGGGHGGDGNGHCNIADALIRKSAQVGPLGFQLFLVLATYANADAQCWPSEKTLGDLVGRKVRAVRNAIRALETEGWIEVKRQKQLPNRYTLLALSRPAENCRSSVQDRQDIAGQEAQDRQKNALKTGDLSHSRPAENRRGSITQEPLPKEPKTEGAATADTLGNGSTGSKRFKPPELAEVAAYCRERKNGIDPQRWMDHYTANGWKVGKNPMKDWRAAVRTWEGPWLEEGHANGHGSRRSAAPKMLDLHAITRRTNDDP